MSLLIFFNQAATPAAGIDVEGNAAWWQRHWQAQLEQLRNVRRDATADGAIAYLTVMIEPGEATGGSQTAAATTALPYSVVAGAPVTEIAGTYRGAKIVLIGAGPIGDAWAAPAAAIHKIKIAAGAARVHASVGGAVASVRVDGRRSYQSGDAPRT